MGSAVQRGESPVTDRQLSYVVTVECTNWSHYLRQRTAVSGLSCECQLVTQSV